MKLTARQSQVLDIIRHYIDDTGYPPTRADIARELGFKSANAAEEHLRALARKGAIEMVAAASACQNPAAYRLSVMLPPATRYWLRKTSMTIAMSLPTSFHPLQTTFCASGA